MRVKEPKKTGARSACLNLTVKYSNYGRLAEDQYLPARVKIFFFLIFIETYQRVYRAYMSE